MKIALAVCVVAIVAVGYNGYTTRVALEDKITELERQDHKAESSIGKLQTETTALSSDIDVVSKKLGVTSQDLMASRKYAEQLRKEQEQAKEQLTTELSKKAATTDVAAVAREANSKIAAAQQDASSKIIGVSGEVKVVATDLQSARQDIATGKREVSDLGTQLRAQIARNSSELADLRKKGERDYFEFDVKKDKKNPVMRVADIQLELKDTDPKRQKYNVVIHVDDSKLEKKERTANEPIAFLVGRDKLRYEVVVNFVDKDRIRGYLSTPKDKVLSAEKPGFKTPQ